MKKFLIILLFIAPIISKAQTNVVIQFGAGTAISQSNKTITVRPEISINAGVKINRAYTYLSFMPVTSSSSNSAKILLGINAGYEVVNNGNLGLIPTIGYYYRAMTSEGLNNGSEGLAYGLEFNYTVKEINGTSVKIFFHPLILNNTLHSLFGMSAEF